MRLPFFTLFLAASSLRGADALAATFVVTSTSDAGAGSLRQAVIDANAASSDDTIAFNIPGNGPHTIVLGTALPSISGRLVVDGYTQPGSAPNTLTTGEGGLNAVLAIELTSPGFSFNTFNLLSSTHLTLQGLAIHGFGNVIVGPSNSLAGTGVQVLGNYIGTNREGLALG